MSLVPHSVALALLSSRNEQRRSPRRYVYKRLKLLRSQSWQSAILCRILHIHGRHCCFDHDYCFGTARFPSVRFKASSNAFPIYRFPSRSLHPWASAFLRPDGSKPASWSGSENNAKIQNFWNNQAINTKKERKIAFHKACETSFGVKNGRNV